MVIITDKLILDRFNHLKDHLLKRTPETANEVSLVLEKNFMNGLKFFLHDKSAKILFTLHVLGFSSVTELSNPARIGLMPKIDIWNNLRDLEAYGVVRIIRDNDPMYKLIQEFWKKQYRTSPCMPKLFIITDEFKEIVSLYEDPFRKKYLWQDTLARIYRRRRDYDIFVKKEKPRIDAEMKRESEKIGNCHLCGWLIPKNTKKGSYQRYGNVLICNTCNPKTTSEERALWINKK